MVVKYLIVILFVTLGCNSQNDRRRGEDARQLPGNLVHHNSEERHVTVTSNINPQWSSFVPSIPEDGEVECFVEIFRTERRGGRCTQLAFGHTFICQSGEYFEFMPECSRVVHNREVNG